MALTAPARGKDCKLYYNTGTRASPTWVLIPRIVDLSYDDDSDEELDASSRESDFKAMLPGQTTLSISFGYKPGKTGDTVYDYLTTKRLAKTPVEFAILNGAADDSEARGRRAFFYIQGKPETQNLGETEMVNFSLKHACHYESGARMEPIAWTPAASSSSA